MVVLNFANEVKDGFHTQINAKNVVITCGLPKHDDSDDLAIKVSELILAFNTLGKANITHLYLPNTQVMDDWKSHNVSFHDMKVNLLDEFYRESVFG